MMFFVKAFCIVFAATLLVLSAVASFVDSTLEMSGLLERQFPSSGSSTIEKRQGITFATLSTFNGPGCSSPTTNSSLEIEPGSCIRMDTPFQGFQSCIMNPPPNGYCMTRVFSDSGCQNLLTEIDPLQQQPCTNCFNVSPSSEKANSVQVLCYERVVDQSLTATFAGFMSPNCQNIRSSDETLAQVTLTNGEVAQIPIPPNPMNNPGFLAFKCLVNQPSYTCKVAVYSDSAATLLVGVINTLTSYLYHCVNTFQHNAAGQQMTGQSALMTCYKVIE